MVQVIRPCSRNRSRNDALFNATLSPNIHIRPLFHEAQTSNPHILPRTLCLLVALKDSNGVERLPLAGLGL